MLLDASYEGELFLWFSLYSPLEQQDNNSSSSSPSLSEQVEYWLIKEFLCGSDEIVSIRLVQDTLLTNTCIDESSFLLRDHENYLRKRQRRRLALHPDTVVLWNEPTSKVTKHRLAPRSKEEEEEEESLRYTFWNVSFPVFDWGSENRKNPWLVQKDVQHLLEQKIWQRDLGVPIDGGVVLAHGDEDDFWNLLVPSMPPSSSLQHHEDHQVPPEEVIPPPLLPPTGPTITAATTVGVAKSKIDPREARNLMYIGILLIVVQTILSMLLYQYGKYFRAIQQEKEELIKERENLDQMLLRSSHQGVVEIDRGLDTIEASESLLLEPNTSISMRSSRSEPMVSKLASGEWYVATTTNSTVASVDKTTTNDYSTPHSNIVDEKKRRRSSHDDHHHQKKREEEQVMDDSVSTPSSSSPITKQKERVSISSSSTTDKKKRSSHHQEKKEEEEQVMDDSASIPSSSSPSSKHKERVSISSSNTDKNKKRNSHHHQKKKKRHSKEQDGKHHHHHDRGDHGSPQKNKNHHHHEHRHSHHEVGEKKRLTTTSSSSHHSSTTTTSSSQRKRKSSSSRKHHHHHDRGDYTTPYRMMEGAIDDVELSEHHD